jgi:integrator complex subunit 11
MEGTHAAQADDVIEVVPLGAGHEVGRSCVVVRAAGRVVVCDCGLHPGVADAARFPNLPAAFSTGDLTAEIDAVVVTHFHLDHAGALPLLTEAWGYRGPLLMTAPTRDLALVSLEDYGRIPGNAIAGIPPFTPELVRASLARATTMHVHEAVRVPPRPGSSAPALTVTAVHAGHVVGAVGFVLDVGPRRVFYTGDFNCAPERHLEPARFPPGLRPDVVISEATNATVNLSGASSETTTDAHVWRAVADVAAAGGKVLVPVSALGRAQEALLALQELRDSGRLSCPVVVAGALVARATRTYRAHVDWCAAAVRERFLATPDDALALRDALPWHADVLDQPGPVVVLATPGLLTTGVSARCLRAWAPGPGNLVVLPGYCQRGTPGFALQNGDAEVRVPVADEGGPTAGADDGAGEGGVPASPTAAKRRRADAEAVVPVRCRVESLSFSAHADAAGILGTLEALAPAAVVLVHGEPLKMATLRQRVEDRLRVPCVMPRNWEPVRIAVKKGLP